MIDDPVVYDKAIVEGAADVLNADHSISTIIEGKVWGVFYVNDAVVGGDVLGFANGRDV